MAITIIACLVCLVVGFFLGFWGGNFLRAVEDGNEAVANLDE